MLPLYHNPQFIKDVAAVEAFIDAPPSDNQLYIGTHSDKFHADDCLAVYMLMNYVKRYKAAKVIRSRDPTEWAKCDILVDVGQKFQIPNFFDHHQQGFTEVFDNEVRDSTYNIKLSSAGLVWKYMGLYIIKQLCDDPNIYNDIHSHFYSEFFTAVDANDNGIPIADEVKFHITTDISSLIGFYAGQLMDFTSNFDYYFYTASSKIGALFDEHLKQYIYSIESSKVYFENDIKNINSLDPQGRLFQLSRDYYAFPLLCEWERKNNKVGNTLFFVHNNPDIPDCGIKCVPIGKQKFDARIKFNARLRGLSDAKLVQAYNNKIPDAQFVHASGNMGGAYSLAGAVAMCMDAINNP